jgi:hypothetical protein
MRYGEKGQGMELCDGLNLMYCSMIWMLCLMQYHRLLHL